MTTIGATKADLVSVQVILTDREQVVDLNGGWERWLAGCPLPARTTLIAGLTKEEHLVELTVVASVPR